MKYIAAALTFCSILSLTNAIHENANGVDRWCGKAYKVGAPLIEPGGWIDPPTLSKTPLLDLKIQPRILPYLASDDDGAFVVDTSLSNIHGKPFSPSKGVLIPAGGLSARDDHGLVSGSDEIRITITRSDTGEQLAASTIPVDVSDNEVRFALDKFTPQQAPYSIHLVAQASGASYEASTQLFRLPTPDDRSVTKLDNLHGALLIQDGQMWTPILPYSFYLGSGWIGDDFSQVAKYAEYGYNVLHIIPPVDFDWMDRVVAEAEKVGLWIMYDMRHDYQDDEKVRAQVTRYMHHRNMLLWYTADEPDGHMDDLAGTKKSYDLIKSLDPYHPVSLCLNCENYHFEQYAAGADILMSDVYPIGTNTAFSTEYNTVCNTTYGDCGCDNCIGKDDLMNVPTRLDTWSRFSTQLGLPQKPLWATPQAFGDQDFWKRVPTPEEEAAMTMLSINHGAKGVIMWTFPTSDELTDLTSRLGKVLVKQCAGWILGAKLVRLDAEGIDATVWVDKEKKTALVSIVNGKHEALTKPLNLSLPKGVQAIAVEDVLWGDGGWKVGAHGEMSGEGMPAVGVDLLVIKVDFAPVLNLDPNQTS